MKRILVVGAGSGIGESLFSRFKNATPFFPIGISRRGIGFSPTERLEIGMNYKCDLKKESDIVRFADLLKSNNFFPDVVYFCSGNGLFKPVHELAAPEWDEHFSTNVKGVFLLAKELYPILKKADSPLVCFIASTASRQGFVNSSAYCASKHALLGFARAIREEWKPDGIRITSILAGAIDTPIWDNRPEFSKEDMIPAEDLGDFLLSLSNLGARMNLDEILLLPKKGIL